MKILEFMYGLIALICMLCVASLLAFGYIVVWPFRDMITQGLEFVYLAIVGALIALIAACTYHFIRWLSAKVNRVVNHETLLTWGDGEGAMYLQADGLPYHASAMHESAALSTYALDQEMSRQYTQGVLEESRMLKHQNEESKIIGIKNLLTQGKSERAIEQETGIPRHQIRKLLGK